MLLHLVPGDPRVNVTAAAPRANATATAATATATAATAAKGAQRGATLGIFARCGAALGVAVGWAIAPFFGLSSLLRQARTFHPRGPTYHALVVRHRDAGPEVGGLAARLEGPAVVRWSGALWKRSQRLPDVLGCAIRFRRSEGDSAAPERDDQDLLFATILRPWTMPSAPFTTIVRNYLANTYYAVSPFDVGEPRRVYFRLQPAVSPRASRGSREARLASATERGEATLDLGIADGPFGPWSPLVCVRLVAEAEIDGEALRFDPFRDGRGLRPRGFVHALRRGVYRLSQRARPAGRAR
jgi:hypothetical protein